MGRARIYPETKQAHFYGSSYDYRIGVDKEHLETLSQMDDEWKFI